MFKKGDIVKVVKHHMPEACTNIMPPIGSVGLVIQTGKIDANKLNTKVAWYTGDPKWEPMMYEQELEKVGEAE